MQNLIAIGLVGLLGCASAGSRGRVVTDTSYVVGPERGFPSWVEVPAWMEQESRQERSEVDGSRPTVSVVFHVCTWSAMTGMPLFSQEGFAILGNAETDRITEKLLAGSTSASKLTSPRMVVGLGQSSSVAILAPNEPRGGVVFFISPTTIDDEGVDLRFSFQCARFPLGDESKSARGRFGIARLEGHAKLGVGQSYVRAVEGDYPLNAGTDTAALFIQIARVDYPEEPVEERVALLGVAHRSVE